MLPVCALEPLGQHWSPQKVLASLELGPGNSSKGIYIYIYILVSLNITVPLESPLQLFGG